MLSALLIAGCTIVFKKTYYQVEFYVQDELVSTQTVLQNRAAKAPEDPVIDGYIFMGWDQQFDYITKDTKIHAILIEQKLEDLEKLKIDLNALKKVLQGKTFMDLDTLPIQGEKYQSTINWVPTDTNASVDESGNLQVIEGTKNISLHVILSLNDSVIYYEFVL